MKENQSIQIHGDAVVLVPYRRKFVPRYHEWMQDPHLLLMTASEPLSLQEEYEMQQSWRDDGDKCTFIVLLPADSACREEAEGVEDGKIARMIGDVNLFVQKDDRERAEIDVMIAEALFRGQGRGLAAVKAMMWYGVHSLGIKVFVAKIREDNHASRRMFERLGYREVQYVEVFHEVEYDSLSISIEEIMSYGETLRLVEYADDDERMKDESK